MRNVGTFLLGLGVTSAALLGARPARANGFEFPSNGTEQFGRGAAWVARATDPLAVFYNPAALSRNGNGVSLTVNINIQKICFERSYGGAAGGGVDDPARVGVASNQLYGPNCSDGKPFPNPQVAFQYRLTDKLGFGIAVLGPSAVGKTTYPDTTTNTSVGLRSKGQDIQGPAATRYLLTSTNNTILLPQIGIGYEVAPNLRIGASFIWGIAVLKFANQSMGLNNEQTVSKGRLSEAADKDVTASVQAKDLFFPGFTMSAMYTAAEHIDVAAWFHWQSAIHAHGDAALTAFAYENGSPSQNTNTVNTPAGKTEVTVPQPWEAKIGVRYFQSREGVALTQKGGLLKDPLQDEVFDVEADFEFDHDSQFQTLGIALNPGDTKIASPDITLAPVPPNADTPHKWKDSFGVRFGGDYNVLPGRLAVRGGGWYQSASVNPGDLHIDFVPAQRFALTVGGTLRLGSFDIQAAYGHVFFKTLDNGGNGNLHGSTGTPSSTSGAVTPYTSDFAINGGKLTASLNVVSLGVVYRWQ